MRPTTLGVIGLGAIGGSLAWAARRAGVRAYGWSPRPAERVRAVQLGALDDAPGSAEDVARRADLLVLAVPHDAGMQLLAALAGLLRKGALVTDVASVKATVAARARALGLADRFAGSHPFVEIGGAGFDAARPERLRGALVYVCPTGDAPEPAREVAHFWEDVAGAQAVVLDPERHDAQVAWTAHLARVVGGAVTAALAANVPAGATPSTSTCEASRWASGPPSEQLETLLANRAELVPAIRAVEAELARYRSGLETGDTDALRECLAAGAAWRRARVG